MNEDKERLLKVCKVYGKKRKPRPPKEKTVKVDSIPSEIFSRNVESISYVAKSSDARQALREIAGTKDDYLEK